MMNEKDLIKAIGGGVSPLTMYSTLMTAIAAQNSKLTPEERAERKHRRELLEKERMRKAMIMNSKCPDCEGKLVRGKKDKKNDYKRVWNCSECENSHSL